MIALKLGLYYWFVLYASTNKIFQIMTMGWPYLVYAMPKSNLITLTFCMGKKKIIYFSKTIAAYDLKVSTAQPLYNSFPWDSIKVAVLGR